MLQLLIDVARRKANSAQKHCTKCHRDQRYRALKREDRRKQEACKTDNQQYDRYVGHQVVTGFIQLIPDM